MQQLSRLCVVHGFLTDLHSGAYDSALGSKYREGACTSDLIKTVQDK